MAIEGIQSELLTKHRKKNFPKQKGRKKNAEG
jgi:hypothetical protein